MSIFRLSRPVQLILAALACALGSGIAHYLGAGLHWPSLLLGLLATLTLLGAVHILTEYFRMPFMPLAPEETPRLREQRRVHILQSAYAFLTVSGAAVVGLILLGALSLSTCILLGLAWLLLIAYAVPPLRLSETGYGELILAVFFGTFLPAFSFFLQTNDFHRLLPLVTIPLTLLSIAWLLALNFPTFASDQKLGRRSLLIRLTWQRAVPIHHLLILGAFLMFASMPFLGVAWGLVWPVFLALPFAVLQMVWVQRIANGGTPLWKFFNVLTPSVFALIIYLLTIAFWLR